MGLGEFVERAITVHSLQRMPLVGHVPFTAAHQRAIGSLPLQYQNTAQRIIVAATSGDVVSLLRTSSEHAFWVSFAQALPNILAAPGKTKLNIQGIITRENASVSPDQYFKCENPASELYHRLASGYRIVIPETRGSERRQWLDLVAEANFGEGLFSISKEQRFDGLHLFRPPSVIRLFANTLPAPADISLDEILESSSVAEKDTGELILEEYASCPYVAAIGALQALESKDYVSAKAMIDFSSHPREISQIMHAQQEQERVAIEQAVLHTVPRLRYDQLRSKIPSELHALHQPGENLSLGEVLGQKQELLLSGLIHYLGKQGITYYPAVPDRVEYLNGVECRHGKNGIGIFLSSDDVSTEVDFLFFYGGTPLIVEVKGARIHSGQRSRQIELVRRMYEVEPVYLRVRVGDKYSFEQVSGHMFTAKIGGQSQVLHEAERVVDLNTAMANRHAVELSKR